MNMPHPIPGPRTSVDAIGTGPDAGDSGGIARLAAGVRDDHGT